jgi:hypothetical protein
MERRYREALEQIDEPGGDERLRQLAKEQEQDKLWQDKLHTSEGVELVADNLYGFLLEGLYLTTELCFLSNYDPSSMMYVAYCAIPSRPTTCSTAWATAGIRHLGRKARPAQFPGLHLVILGDKPVIAPAQLDALRPAIAKARNQIVQ